MNFDLTEEQQLLADSLKRYLANEYSIDKRAKIVDSASGWSETVWANASFCLPWISAGRIRFCWASDPARATSRPPSPTFTQ